MFKDLARWIRELKTRILSKFGKSLKTRMHNARNHAHLVAVERMLILGTAGGSHVSIPRLQVAKFWPRHRRQNLQPRHFLHSRPRTKRTLAPCAFEVYIIHDILAVLRA